MSRNSRDSRTMRDDNRGSSNSGDEPRSHQEASFSFKFLAFLFGFIVSLWIWSGCDVDEIEDGELGDALHGQVIELDQSEAQGIPASEVEAQIIGAGEESALGIATDTQAVPADSDENPDENPNTGGDDQEPVNPEPEYETGDCLSPLVIDGLTTVTGKTAFLGDTTRAVEGMRSSCDDAGGPAEIWAIKAPYSGAMEVVMDSRNRGDFGCSLSVRSECDATSTELECDNDRVSDDDGVCSVTIEAVKDEIYYVIAGTFDPQEKGGAYALELFNPAIGDTCGNPRLAYIDQEFSSDTFFASDDYSSGCDSDSTGSDQVWVFTPTFEGTIEVVAETGLGGDFGCGLSVRESCHEADSEVGCARSTVGGEGGCRLTLEVKPGKNYYVFVDTGSEAEIGGLYHLGIHSI